MKLFYSPGACSLVAHIALEEAQADHELVRVVLAEGEHLKPDYLAINPHARVPALVTDRGTITENVAILNVLADLFGQAGSVPRGDPFQAARCNELLGWLASTVHISFAQIWRASRFTADESAHGAVQKGGREALDRHFAEIEGLCGDGWIVGDGFSGVDSYAMTFFRWGGRIGADMSRYPRWRALAERALDRRAVKAAIETEGLDPAAFLDS